jgi:hypothetical protein
MNVRHCTFMEEREMINRKAFVVFGLALASLMVFSDAHASDIDQATKLTFSQSVQIPGQVLPAGTYWFVVRIPDVIQVFSSDRSTLYATLLTGSAELLLPVEKSTVIFADRGSMQPGAIVTWFYPGETIGHEFIYSKRNHEEIAQAKQRMVHTGN